MHVHASDFQATYAELSPNYAGTINGIANGTSSLLGFICPLIVSYIIDGNVSLSIIPFLSFLISKILIEDIN